MNAPGAKDTLWWGALSAAQYTDPLPAWCIAAFGLNAPYDLTIYLAPPARRDSAHAPNPAMMSPAANAASAGRESAA